MHLKFVYQCAFLVYFCSAKTTKPATVKRSTTLKSKATVKTTKLTECYQMFRGSSGNKYINNTSIKKCDTNCYSFLMHDGANLTQAGSCNPENTNLGGCFIVEYNFSFAYDICDYNLCNTPDIFKTPDYRCEFNKKVPKTKKLTFRNQKPKEIGVKQCYFCEKCNTYNNAKVVNCEERNATIKNFSCIHSYEDINGVRSWNGDCIEVSNMALISYDKMNSKLMTCQTELCNSPTAVKNFDKAILCQDGFYV